VIIGSVGKLSNALPIDFILIYNKYVTYWFYIPIIIILIVIIILILITKYNNINIIKSNVNKNIIITIIFIWFSLDASQVQTDIRVYYS